MTLFLSFRHKANDGDTVQTMQPGGTILKPPSPGKHWPSVQARCRPPRDYKVAWVPGRAILSSQQGVALHPRDTQLSIGLILYVHTNRDKRQDYFLTSGSEGAITVGA
jgi:hypothetical protein